MRDTGHDEAPFGGALTDLPDTGPAGGEPGAHLRPEDLAPDEERLLAALERDAAALHVDPVDTFVAALRAGREEAPLPAEGGAPDDGLTPLFAAPELDEG